MVSRDYTKEIGLPSGTKTVPKPVAAVVIIAILVGGWYAGKTLVTEHHVATVEQVQPAPRR